MTTIALLWTPRGVPEHSRQPTEFCASVARRMTEAAPSDDDNALLERVASGDHAAFALYYDRVSGPLFSMALRMLGNEQEAQDALLEGMEHLWQKAPGFDRQRASAFSWAVMLFRSRLIDRVRRRATQARLIENITAQANLDPHDDQSAIERLGRLENCSIVQRALGGLREEQQILLQQAFFSGLTQQEIAEQTGRPLGTVKTIIRRALLELRAQLQREGYEP